jgi:malonyl-ACP decarboxylase
MTISSASSPVITGLGIVTAIGQNKATFSEAIFAGQSAFGYLCRPGREGAPSFIGAEIASLDTESLRAEHRRLLRNASLTAQCALMVAQEAWEDAQLHTAVLNPERVGLVIGGSNVQQREQWQTWQRYAARPNFLSPTYGVTLWDSDLVGILSQALQIQGEGFSVGSASASGGAAIVQAARQIQSGCTDVCLVVGALFDLSAWECQGFRNLGAMGSSRFQEQPSAACRPFDQDSDGFIYGEGSAALVLESAEHARQRGARPYGRLLGWSSVLDGNRQANPSEAGEVRAMQAALQMADVTAAQISYVNTHGTSSPLGDRTELTALNAVGLRQAPLNATKSLTGHCLTAAGVVEAAATLLQMEAGRLHPTRNLVNPLDDSFCWVGETGMSAEIEYALSNSFGFGGINTTLVFGRIEENL